VHYVVLARCGRKHPETPSLHCQFGYFRGILLSFPLVKPGLSLPLRLSFSKKCGGTASAGFFCRMGGITDFVFYVETTLTFTFFPGVRSPSPSLPQPASLFPSLRRPCFCSSSDSALRLRSYHVKASCYESCSFPCVQSPRGFTDSLAPRTPAAVNVWFFLCE